VKGNSALLKQQLGSPKEVLDMSVLFVEKVRAMSCGGAMERLADGLVR
jgi:hypothetical protein